MQITVNLRRPARRSLALVAAAFLLAIPGVALASHQFSDVPDGHPFHSDISWMSTQGISTGFDDDTYRPEQAVTRQAMAAFMHRLSNAIEVVSSSPDLTPRNYFFLSVACPDNKRPVSGGVYQSATNLFVTSSFPNGGSWQVTLESENDLAVDPPVLTVYATCVPRF